jgi:hypothetical protein
MRSTRWGDLAPIIAPAVSHLATVSEVRTVGEWCGANREGGLSESRTAK